MCAYVRPLSKPFIDHIEYQRVINGQYPSVTICHQMVIMMIGDNWQLLIMIYDVWRPWRQLTTIDNDWWWLTTIEDDWPHNWWSWFTSKMEDDWPHNWWSWFTSKMEKKNFFEAVVHKRTDQPNSRWGKEALIFEITSLLVTSFYWMNSHDHTTNVSQVRMTKTLK